MQGEKCKRELFLIYLRLLAVELFKTPYLTGRTTCGFHIGGHQLPIITYPDPVSTGVLHWSSRMRIPHRICRAFPVSTRKQLQR